MDSLMRGGRERPDRYVTRPELRSAALTSGLNVPNVPQTLLYSQLQRTGNRVDFEAAFRVTATVGAVSFWMSLPYPTIASGQDLAQSIGRFAYRRTGVAYATGLVCQSSTATTAHFTDYSNNRWTGTSPYAIAAPDDFWVSLSYFTTP